MAADNKSTNVEEQIGISNYLLKQLYQITVSVGSILGGAYAGLVATKPFFKEKASEVVKNAEEMFSTPRVSESERSAARWKEIPYLSKIPGIRNIRSFKQLQWGAGGGAFVGMLASFVVLGYEHWKKIKQSQLQVDEITKDVSDIEVFKKTDPELKAENDRLWAELKKRDSTTTMAEKFSSSKKESWRDKTAEHADIATEASR